MGKKLQQNLTLILFIVLIFLSINLILYHFISQERFFYFWDFLGYYAKFQGLASLIQFEPLVAFNAVLNSVRVDDYNYLAAVLIQPFYFLFGGSRLSYILAVGNIYLFPAILLFGLIGYLLSQKNYPTPKTFFFMASILALTFFPFFKHFTFSYF